MGVAIRRSSGIPCWRRIIRSGEHVVRTALFTEDASRIREAMTVSMQIRKPLFVGEFGVSGEKGGLRCPCS